jgi:phosphoglycerol transferase MdoB-like AlkP superfamily enzyme
MFITRCALLGFSVFLNQTSIGINSPIIFAIGAVYDLCTALYFLPVIIIFSLVLPKIITKQRACTFAILFLGLYFLTFISIAEIIFWDEFGTRFNFIAVDYLVYTHEVIRNIFESYPMIKILLLISLFSGVAAFLIQKYLLANLNVVTKLRELLFITLLLIALHFSINDTTFELADRYENEIAHNGIYNLFAAFKNNTLNYQSFYKTIDIDRAFTIVREKLRVRENAIDNTHSARSISRIIDNGKAKGYNVILVTVESLNANYLGSFGNTEKLTPYLDKLSKDSLSFTNYYATGTRTIRGLEAITLSIPPTPGNSIVRRPNNENLFSLGSVLNKAGYDLKFLYGGYGYFDNMNYFFSNNHFQTVDRSNLVNEEISFANAWGVADEDIFKRTIHEADQAFAKQQNFFYFIMTTSNHRPYTYPNDRIDIPSGTGRNGAIKYTDYAIKLLIESAKNKPWFDKTIFIITADHCAGSAGKNDLPIERYHIPFFIYAPKIIKPKEIPNLASQIDVAPTILSLLGISYESKFYGTDVINHPANRALISTYQKLGYYTPGNLVILGPKFEVKSFAIDNHYQAIPSHNENKINEGISFYQTAYFLFVNGLMAE